MFPLLNSFLAPDDQVPGDEKYRVLVVEDNPDLAKLATLMLQFCGFDVHTLYDGRLVLAKARAFRPHFILLDIGLPGMDGYQVAELLRKDPELSNVVIIAISAYSPDSNPGRSCLAKFDHYLVKPVDFESLLALMKPRLQ